jgi:hypothetical protein
VGEADDLIRVLGKDRPRSSVGSLEPLSPHLEPIGGNVPVEERIGVGTPVVAAPTIRVKRSNSAIVGWPSGAKIPVRRHG